MWVTSVPGFDGKQLQSISKGEVDLDTEEEKKEGESERDQRQKDFAGLTTWMTAQLSDEVKEVRLSSRLTTSPSCLVGDTNDITPALENMFRSMGQEVPQVKRILELNPEHPLVVGLRRAHEERADDPALVETARLVHGMSVLAEGRELGDPSAFTKLLAGHLERTLAGPSAG
jgi:molecular chaperone HtpG